MMKPSMTCKPRAALCRDSVGCSTLSHVFSSAPNHSEGACNAQGVDPSVRGDPQPALTPAVLCCSSGALRIALMVTVITSADPHHEPDP